MKKLSFPAFPTPPAKDLANIPERVEAAVGRYTERLKPAAAWFYGARRRLATAFVAVIAVWLLTHVLLGPNGMVVYQQKRAEYKQLQEKNDRMQLDNERYARQIKALKDDPAAIEKEAREQLGYTRPNEVIYVAPPPTAPPATARK